jgi:hypothetical protein
MCYNQVYSFLAVLVDVLVNKARLHLTVAGYFFVYIKPYFSLGYPQSD